MGGPCNASSLLAKPAHDVIVYAAAYPALRAFANSMAYCC